MIIILFNAAIENKSSDFAPEKFEVLVFGVFLIFLATGMRWIFNRKDERKIEKKING